jgi:hypothetical protein
VPSSLLRATCADDELADQLTGPPTAVRTIEPVEPAPSARLPGDTVRVPAGAGTAGVRLEADPDPGGSAAAEV